MPFNRPRHIAKVHEEAHATVCRHDGSVVGRRGRIDAAREQGGSVVHKLRDAATDSPRKHTGL